LMAMLSLGAIAICFVCSLMPLLAGAATIRSPRTASERDL
jgi:hypothetical protein